MNPAGRPQRVVWHVKQPASGAAAALTITGATTPAGGGVLPLSQALNAVDVIDVWTLDGVNIFAGLENIRCLDFLADEASGEFEFLGHVLAAHRDHHLVWVLTAESGLVWLCIY